MCMSQLPFERDENRGNGAKNRDSVEVSSAVFQEEQPMRAEYIFANAKKNPYVKRQKESF